ncbi:MAG: hypothetical protein KF812_13590, partial [Fimbriimonadaceae bacterium]|nr:hypothetical protein [Fimbriimonadaceae bacterium]
MKDPRARILVLTYTPFAREPRALKQVKYLKATHDVTTAGFGPSPFPDVPHVELPELPPQRWALFGRLLNLGLLVLHWYWPLSWINALDRATVRMLAGDSWDVVIAHDLKVLEASLE